MECEDLEQLLPAYADGEFVAEEKAEVDTHLAGCEGCRAEVASHVAFRTLLRERARGSTTKAPDTLRARIRRDIGVEHTREQTRRFVSVLGVAAGIAVVASGGYVLLDGGERRELVDAVVADAVDKHARALPVEVTPGGGDVDGWFRGKVDFNVRVPRFRSADAPQLVGARLANVRDRQAAYVVYGGEQPRRRMTLLVFPGEELPVDTGRRTVVNGQDVVLANEKGYNVALWSRRGVVYSLVSELDEGDVLKLVGEVEER